MKQNQWGGSLIAKPDRPGSTQWNDRTDPKSLCLTSMCTPWVPVLVGAALGTANACLLPLYCWHLLLVVVVMFDEERNSLWMDSTLGRQGGAELHRKADRASRGWGVGGWGQATGDKPVGSILHVSTCFLDSPDGL